MGIFDFVTNPLRYGWHVASGGVGGAATGATGTVSANFAMSGLRAQLGSYEGRQFFDSVNLAKHFSMYNKIKKRLMKYRGKKVRKGVFESTYIQEKVYNKFKGNPALLNKVLMHQVGIFTRLYEQLLNIISAITMEKADLVLLENASVIKDQEKMRALIQRLPETRDTALIREDFGAMREQIEKQATKEVKKEKRELNWLQKLASGSTKPVRGFAGFFGRMFGVNFLTHKVQKLSKRIFTSDYRRFNTEFTELRSEIQGKRVTPATIARLKHLIDNYIKIRKFYFEIDKDMALITAKLFEDFGVILNECVIPFYAVVKNVKGANQIVVITNQVKAAYNKNVKEVTTEEFELKKVYQELVKFVRTTRDAVGKLQKRNIEVMTNLQQKMALRPAT